MKFLKKLFETKSQITNYNNLKYYFDLMKFPTPPKYSIFYLNVIYKYHASFD